MFSFRNFAFVGAAVCGLVAVANAQLSITYFGLGQTPTPADIALWDIDVRPDGHGVVKGSGNVWDGEEIYIEKCAACHGDFGEAVGRWPVLAGGLGSLDSDEPIKTVGSYWPYLTTAYDYIYRAMPFGNAQSLEPDEVYGILAYLLDVNDLLDDPDEFILSDENIATFELPNRDGFKADDRPTLYFPRCMANCSATEPKIASRARVLDVTPDQE